MSGGDGVLMPGVGESKIEPANILVTGAGGYVGACLTPILLNHGYRVTALDTYVFGVSVLADVVDHANLRVVVGDVTRFDAALLNGIDAVVHLAAISNDPAGALDPSWTSEVNRDATIRLAESCKRLGVPRFIFASSCSVYGAAGDTLLTEDAPLHPLTAYARSKVEAEVALLRMSDHAFRCIVLRKATLFGLSPRMRFDLVVNSMTLGAVQDRQIVVTGGGRQWRPFLHVADAAEAYLRCLQAPISRLGGATFNVVATNEQIGGIARIVSRQLPRSLVVTDDKAVDARDYRVSGHRFRDRLGFVATRRIEHGVKEVAAAISRGHFGDTAAPRCHTARAFALQAASRTSHPTD